MSNPEPAPEVSAAETIAAETIAAETTGEALGFIGLGRMGDPMARNLLAAGHRLVVHDVAPDRLEALARVGGLVAVDAADVAARTGTSLTMLLNDAVLRSVVLGPSGLLGGAAPGHLLCDLSTVSPAVSAEIAAAARERGVRFVRGAVAGSVQPARDGALSVFLSGDPEDVAAVTPLLEPLASSITNVGTGEEAVYLKLVHSTLVAVYSAMIGEALTFGERGGADLTEMVDIVEQGPLGSKQLSLKAPMLKARAFADPPSDVDTAAKDIDLVLDAARLLAVPMPITSAVRQVMAHQQARGGGRRDIWSIIEAFESLASLPKR